MTSEATYAASSAGGQPESAPATVPGTPPRLRNAILTLALLFTATGFVGLVVEQVYEKLLGTLVGSSTPAAATVLAAYFSGLTLGAISYDRYLRRLIRNPLRVYALLEGGVAGLLVVTIILFDSLIPLFAPLLSAARHPFWLLEAARLAVAAVWILPPTFLMGASLPAVADSLAVMRLPSRPRLLTWFYALNLGGAIIAAGVTPYAVFPELGLDGGLALCAAIGGLVCITAIRLSRRFPAARWQVLEQGEVREEGSRGRSLIVAVAFGSGFLFFALEVLWVHLLAAVIGNSVYAFATMLTVVLISLFLGSGLAAFLIPAGRQTSWAFTGAVMLIGGASLALTHGLWQTIPHSLATVGHGIRSFGAAELLRFRHALVVVIFPATFLGMLFPSLFRLADFPSRRVGGFVGKTYAANAIGCVLGALATTFLLLPRFGSELLLTTAATLLLIAGGLVMAWTNRKLWPIAAALAVVACAMAGLPRWDRLRLTSGEHVYFEQQHVRPDSRLLFFHEDTAGGITTVVERPTMEAGKVRPLRTLLTNGKFQGNDGGEQNAQVALAVIPTMLVRHFDDALVIGAGTAASADIVRGLGFRRVRVAEIAPGVLDAARTQFAHLNHGVLDAPNVTIDVEDGRNVLLLDHASYDLVTMEISSIWFANATNLYSREFYRLAKARLRPGGVLQQWIQLHHIDVYDIASTVATMRSVFRYVSFWSAGGQGILVGSDDPQVVRAVALRQMAGLRGRMGWQEPKVFAFVIHDLAGGQLLSPAAVDRMVGEVGVIVNTDRNRFLEYSTPRNNFNRAATVDATTAALQRWSDRSIPPIEPEALAALR